MDEHRTGTIPNRVAIFLPSLRGGGAERMMLNLAHGVAQRGFEVDVVLVKAVGPFLDEVTPPVQVVDLGATRVASSIAALSRYLKRRRPAALLSAMRHANVAAVVAHRLSGANTRLVVSERNMLGPETVARRGPFDALIRLGVRLTYPLADGIATVSRGVAEDLSRVTDLPSERITTIYNPVVSDAIQSLARAPAPHRWLEPGGPPVILAAGRLIDQKGFDVLIRAFEAVCRRRSARLIILGQGPLHAELEALAGRLAVDDDVLFPGFDPNPFAWMARATVFVLSSRWEGLPGVLIQAMACGTRVVSTDCRSGPAEILEGGRYGRLVPVGDVDSLAGSIEATIDDQAPPDVAARAACFSVTRSVDAHLALLGLPQRALAAAVEQESIP
jgi:glycosyltransferase involved in cell wall biosynthesis